MIYDNEKVEEMIIQIENNTGYIASACVENNISVDELIDITHMYKRVIAYLKEQNNGCNLRGLHDDILNELGENK